MSRAARDKLSSMLTGGCFCKLVRYRADASPFHEANCHCSICRRTSGAPFVTWVTVPRASFQLTSGEPRSFASSEDGTRTFCPRCGTPLTFSSRRWPDEIDLTVGSLDAPSAVGPKADIYVDDKLPWVVLNDDLPSYAAERTRSS